MGALLNISDYFVYGKNSLCPKLPCSPYRYIEFLIEVTLQRKYGFKNILEVGPGVDPALGYMDIDMLSGALALDYSEDVINTCRQKVPHEKIEFRLADVTDRDVHEEFRGKFDYVICNSVIEHVEDDQALVDQMYRMTSPGGIVICSTVLHQGMFNSWDHAVGHYRRYSSKQLVDLFDEFDQVQLIKSSILQELVRPLFFGRINHLLENTIEENNKLTGAGHEEWGRPPYAPIWPLLRWLMPSYLIGDQFVSLFAGGIGFVIGRKSGP